MSRPRQALGENIGKLALRFLTQVLLADSVLFHQFTNEMMLYVDVLRTLMCAGVEGESDRAFIVAVNQRELCLFDFDFSGRCRNHMASRAASDVATYSASTVEQATVG